MECGVGTAAAAAAAPGRGHRPGTALVATRAMQVTFLRRRPLSPPAVGAQSGLSLGGRQDVQSRRPRAWPVGHTPAAARPPRPASAHLHREPLAPRALGPRLRRSDRARGCARSSARGAAGGVRRAAAAWAAAEEEEDSGAPL